MKTSSIRSRSLPALAVAALLALNVGCQTPQKPASPGPHPPASQDGKDTPKHRHHASGEPQTMMSPGPHQ